MERVLFAPRQAPPLPPDVAEDPSRYAPWARRREVERARRTQDRPPVPPPAGPLGLIMAVPAGTDADAVSRTLASVRAQGARDWSLTVAVPRDADPAIPAAVRAALPRRHRRRLHLASVPGQPDERALVLAGLAANRGRAVALLFPGDVWAPDAVALLGAALQRAGVAYADEDELHRDGSYREPRLKPSWSPDFLWSSAYVGRPLAIGPALLGELGGLTAPGGEALEHECALVATRAASSVTHVPEVLCHRTVPRTPPAAGTSVAYIDTLLARSGEPARALRDPERGTTRLVRHEPAAARTSVVIPFRDEPRLLRTVVDSVTATTSGDPVELLLVDNGSSDPETLTLVDRLSTRDGVRVLRDPRPFNWARLNNEAAHQATGAVLLFLNNDIEARCAGWLAPLRAHALRHDVGAAGARLVYPDGRLQHCGVVVGLTGAAGHPLSGLAPGAPGYLHMAWATRECSAVTGACLATRREVFEALGGFDEELGVDLNDVDYCLRAAARGWRTVYEPAAELVHHESPSRGTAGGTDDIVNFLRRWRGYITEGDRYFSPRLTRADPSCGLARDDEEDAWSRWFSTLSEP